MRLLRVNNVKPPLLVKDNVMQNGGLIRKEMKRDEKCGKRRVVCPEERKERREHNRGWLQGC